MQNKIKFLIITISLIVICLSCTDMNDKHDIYLKNGEIMYIGRVDSAITFSGKDRFLLRYWIKDLRAKELRIYINNKNDSLVIPIPNHSPTDIIEYMIGSDEIIINEGSHVLRLVCTDGELLKSVGYDLTVNVYGDKFSQTLLNRNINKATFNYLNSEVILDWFAPYSDKEVGIETTYTDNNNKWISVTMTTKEIGTQSKLYNVDITKPITYRTLYLPEPLAIDTFYTKSIEIIAQ